MIRCKILLMSKASFGDTPISYNVIILSGTSSSPHDLYGGPFAS